MAVLGFPCCVRAFSSCEVGRGGEGATRTVVRRSLIALASRVADKPLGLVGFSSCGAQAQLPRGMWNLPGSGSEPMFPALEGGCLSTIPPVKSKEPPSF